MLQTMQRRHSEIYYTTGLQRSRHRLYYLHQNHSYTIEYRQLSMPVYEWKLQY